MQFVRRNSSVGFLKSAFGCALALFLSAAGLVAPANAIEISRASQSDIGCTVIVSGQIREGDAERLLDWFQDNDFSVHEDQAGRRVVFDFDDNRLCFDSPGGSFLEGAEIARALVQISTGVDAGHQCLSACFLAFMAGSYNRLEDRLIIPDRVMHPTATVGFHAPGLRLTAGSFTDGELLEAWDLALSSVAELLDVRRTNPNYAFRDELLEEMLRTPFDRMAYIETVGQATLYNITVFPVVLPGPLSDAGSEAFVHACRSLGRMSTDFGVVDGPQNAGLSVSERGWMTYSAAFDVGESGTRCNLTYTPGAGMHATWMLGSMHADDWWIPPNDFAVSAFIHYPPETRIADLPSPPDHAARNAAIISDAIAEVGGAAAAMGCGFPSTLARVINVNQFVNLRDQPSLSGNIVERATLGQFLDVWDPGDWRVPPTPEGGACARVCRALETSPRDPSLQRRARQCIDDKLIWFQVSRERGPLGYVSGYFLEAIR